MTKQKKNKQKPKAAESKMAIKTLNGKTETGLG